MLPSPPSLLTAVTVGGVELLAAYRADPGAFDLYAVNPADGTLRRRGSVAAPRGCTQIDACTFSNRSYLLTYEKTHGQFALIQLNPDLTSGGMYTLTRAHAPGMSLGFSTVKAFVHNGGVSLLAYAFETGAVSMYSLAALAATSGTPPLTMQPIWDHPWSKGWTDFAFFTLGAGYFFFKINTVYRNVNIDHIRDDASTGTSEVSSHMALAASADVSAAAAVYLADQDRSTSSAGTAALAL